MLFYTNEDKAIKEIFKYFKGWSYLMSCSEGKVYWEINFKENLDNEIAQILRKRVYELPFEPAVSIGKNSVASFYGLYNIESLRKELELAEFSNYKKTA